MSIKGTIQFDPGPQEGGPYGYTVEEPAIAGLRWSKGGRLQQCYSVRHYNKEGICTSAEVDWRDVPTEV